MKRSKNQAAAKPPAVRPPHPMQQRGPVAHEREKVLVYLGIESEYLKDFTHHSSALALQSPSGAGAAGVAGFGLCDFGTTFSKKVVKQFKSSLSILKNES